jgi:Flp pilus assembly protein TadD
MLRQSLKRQNEARSDYVHALQLVWRSSAVHMDLAMIPVERGEPNKARADIEHGLKSTRSTPKPSPYWAPRPIRGCSRRIKPACR